PDVANRRRKLDMPQALPPDLGQRHLDTALLADNAFVLHALVLAAQALVILHRAENARAEQPVALRLEGAVVDRLRLLDLPIGPGQNFLRARNADANLVEILLLDLRTEEIDDFLIHSLFSNGRLPPLGMTSPLRSAYSGRRPRQPRSNRLLVRLRLHQLDVQPERPHFLDEHVEALGDAGFESIVAAHDRLVDLGAAGNVVRLDGQHLLQGVGRAIGLERPHLHFTEALSAELCFAAERLLGDEAVRANRAGMDLVVHEVMELQHINVAYRHLALERLAGAPVMQGYLPRGIKISGCEQRRHVALMRAIEHRGRHRNAGTQIVAHLDQMIVFERIDRLVVAIDLLEQVLERLYLMRRVVGVEGFADLAAQAPARPAEMRLQDLPNIHAARHAKRVQHDVDRRAVVEIRHVLDRHDLANHALVAMTAGHLIARLDLALHRDEHLDHLHHARRQLVAALQLVDLVDEALLEPLLGVFLLAADGLDLGHRLLVLERHLPPMRARHFVEHRLGDLGVLLETLRPFGDDLVHQHVFETAVHVAVEDGELVVAVLGETLDLLALDGHGALVLLDAVAVVHPHLV